MGELIVLGVLLWWVFSAMKKGKKKPKTVQPTAPASVDIEELLADDADDADDADEAAEYAEQLTMLDTPNLLEEPARALQKVLTAEGMGTGRSMQANAPEGIDPCHPGEAAIPRLAARSVQMEERMQPVPPKEGFEPDFSPEAMRQAVVMSEILTRPCERRRRRYYP